MKEKRRNGPSVQDHIDDRKTESFFEQLTGEILRKTQSQSISVAVDGTVIQAAASRYRTIKKEAAEEAAKAVTAVS